MTVETGAAAGHQEGGEHTAHGNVRTYVMIGIILTVITAAEVAIFYIPALDRILIPALVIMSATKFVLVVGFYMHLKFDHPIFSRVFYGPMLLAVIVVIGLLVLFKYLPRFDMY
jgi:cytochrome c oxidase subunit 4